MWDKGVVKNAPGTLRYYVPLGATAYYLQELTKGTRKGHTLSNVPLDDLKGTFRPLCPFDVPFTNFFIFLFLSYIGT